jgi:Zn-dependent protease with chaperone function
MNTHPTPLPHLLVSQFIPGITDGTATLGLANIPVEHEQAIRSLLAKLSNNTADDIFIKQLTPGNENAICMANGCWLDGDITKKPIRLLFVSKKYYEELSEAEQHFVIAHELSHLESNHFPKRVTYVRWLNGRLATLVGMAGSLYFYAAILLPTIVRWWRTGIFDMSPSFTIVTGIILVLLGCFSIIRPLASNIILGRLYRNQEFEADYAAIEKLNTIDGATEFLNRMAAHHPKVTWLQSFSVTHPKPEDRLAKIQKQFAQMQTTLTE